MNRSVPIAQAAYQPDFALHTLGWKAFQDLCAQVCAESLKRAVSIHREAQDGGQDAVFLLPGDQGFRQATVQCKFSGKPEQRLKVGDITAELDSVSKLVKEGLASAYYLITNMGVDAPVAARIKSLLKSKGVDEPEVLGREWLIAEIRASARLRALVPRVYGLGDLSSIIDERYAAQTRELLGHLLPTLRIYVPTAAHRMAVRTLAEHKLVLLLGAPATGKSMLAAILATMAADTDHLECLKCEGPIVMRERWNPNEPKRLFWVDDAFGPNQLRDDYVDAWIEFMPKMKAAIDQGCHFILTSRTHIWNEAKYRLGTRNHQLMSGGKAVVNVSQLSPEERQQILYNHVKEGQQPTEWKSEIKPHLADVAEEQSLLPEIARRLGDPHYTSAIKKLPDDLIEFVRKPQEFLKGTIQELVVSQQAAMTLVFLARSRLPVDGVVAEMQLVADKYATPVASIVQALEQLEGAFLIRREEGGQRYWSFVHPTFADAISSILSARPDLVELYLRGARIETLLSEAICEGGPRVDDAVLVPATSFEILVSRLLETPDEAGSNEQLFQFLHRRATPEILERVLRLDSRLLGRSGSPSPWSKVARHAEILLRASAYSRNLLTEDLRTDTCATLEDAALFRLDVSFLADEQILAMFRPHELIVLTLKIVGMLDDRVPSDIASIEEDADPDGDIDDQFEPVSSFLEGLDLLGEHDDQIGEKLTQLVDDITAAKERLEARKQPDDEESFFNRVPTSDVIEERSQRSIFSDVDQ